MGILDNMFGKGMPKTNKEEMGENLKETLEGFREDFESELDKMDDPFKNGLEEKSETPVLNKTDLEEKQKESTEANNNLRKELGGDWNDVVLKD